MDPFMAKKCREHIEEMKILCRDEDPAVVRTYQTMIGTLSQLGAYKAARALLLLNKSFSDFTDAYIENEKLKEPN